MSPGPGRIVYLTGSAVSKDQQLAVARTSASTGGTPLVRALYAAGGIPALARHLRVPKKQLTSWMEGDAELPRVVLARALEFVRGRQGG